MAKSIFETLARIKKDWDTAFPSEEAKARAAARVDRQQLIKDTRERDDANLENVLKLAGFNNREEAEKALRAWTLEQKSEDADLERNERLQASTIANKKDLVTTTIGATSKANIDRDTVNQNFLLTSLDKVGSAEQKVLDRFLGSTALADNYFGLERDKLDLMKQAYADSRKPPTFLEGIMSMAPALATTALALFA